MPSPDQEHKSDSTSLDAERARLRSAGYTDAEISQILIARASPQPAAAGQGALSNALSSIVAVASHARAIIPNLRKDVATMFDGAAAASARAGATASLAVKAIVILVLGYAAWQEWKIHIIYASEQSEAEAFIKHQQACASKFSFDFKTGVVVVPPDCQSPENSHAVSPAVATATTPAPEPTCKMDQGTPAQRGDCTKAWAAYYRNPKKPTCNRAEGDATQQETCRAEWDIYKYKLNAANAQGDH
jgi:hypothetical protein